MYFEKSKDSFDELKKDYIENAHPLGSSDSDFLISLSYSYLHSVKNPPKTAGFIHIEKRITKPIHPRILNSVDTRKIDGLIKEKKTC